MNTFLLSIVVFASLSIVVVILRLFLRKQLSRYTLSGWWRLSSLIVLHVGVALILTNLGRLNVAIDRYDWPSAPGKVVSARLADSVNFVAVLDYSYMVGNHQYSGTTDLGAPGFGSKSKRFQAAETLINLHRAGDSLTVYYNPDKLSESVVIRNLPWFVYMQLFFGATVFMLGFGLLLLPKRPRAAS